MTNTLTANRTDAVDAPGAEWWRSAVIYQIYPRSFADANGDGIGDLPGITSRLPHLAALGIDAVWLSPFFVSPMADAGYDVADYRDIDPRFGTLADADALVAEAKRLGLRVIIDLVPNHTSDEHEWFQQALAAGPGTPERGRYMFREGRGENGELPPNSWVSRFGGSAWTRVTEPDGTPGQWYLHLFDPKQPDLDWGNAEVREEFHDILRFWLDRGIDGFRVDVAHGLIKADGLPEWEPDQEMVEGANERGERPPMWDQDGVHEIYREWRRVLEAYDGERILVAEAWVEPMQRLALYVRPDEMHQAFNFDYLTTPWRATDLQDTVTRSLATMQAVGAPTTWVLSNHDVIRHTTRLTLDPDGPRRPTGIGPDHAQPDEELGLRRGRAASVLMLALPGSAYVYQGEELGLPEHTTLPHDARQDPSYFRNNGAIVGRDGCRVPIPWHAGEPAHGFSSNDDPWLPQPESFSEYAADAQQGVEGSTLELYRNTLRLRRELGLGLGELSWAEGYGRDVVAFRTVGADSEVLVVSNLGGEPVELPADARVLLASDALDEHGRVPTDVTVWAYTG